MATPISPIPNLSQYNYKLGDDNEVVIKQNGVNAEIDALVPSINTAISSINTDMVEIEAVKNDLNPAQIVHAPDSGLSNEAGAAYSRDVVGGSGSVMAQGAFGLGGILETYPNPSINTIPTYSALFKVGLNETGGNQDLPISTNRAHLINLVRATLGAPASSQILIAEDSEYVGVRASGASLSPFKSLYHNRNTLGVVSKSSGVPSGSLFESDSNSDGAWEVNATGRIKIRMLKTISLSATTSFDLPKSLSSLSDATISVTVNSDLGAWANSTDRGRFQPNARFSNLSRVDILSGSTFLTEPASGETGSVFITIEGEYL